jgi:hypothetical protein
MYIESLLSVRRRDILCSQKGHECRSYNLSKTAAVRVLLCAPLLSTAKFGWGTPRVIRRSTGWNCGDGISAPALA